MNKTATTSLSQDQMLEVMAYADGELTGGDEDRVRKLVETDPEAKELFASLRAIGDGVRSTLDVESVDVRDAVMGKLRPNDLDKARLRRVARTRVAIVGASIVAIAAAVLFYVREANNGAPTSQNPPSTHEPDSVLASAGTSGVQVDFVDTPSTVSVFYVPASVGAEGQPTDTAPSVVVWVDDPKAPEPKPETTP